MKEKGFTLIELLAVIVILAIISLIAVPIVLNIITNAKEAGALRSAELYIHGIEISLTKEELYSKNTTDGLYNINTNGDICLDSNCITVDMKGEKPTSGMLRVEKGTVIQIINMNIDSMVVSTVNDKLELKELDLKIHFTIDTQPFECPLNMTWEEFSNNLDYNKTGITGSMFMKSIYLKEKGDIKGTDKPAEGVSYNWSGPSI